MGNRYPKFIILSFLIILPYSCIDNMQIKKNEFKENHKLELKNYLLRKLNLYNKNIDNNKDFDIWINSIVKKPSGLGVYYFGRVGSHISRKNFFLFDENNIFIIKSNIERVVVNKIQTFLLYYHFTEKEKQNCITEVKKILQESTGDSF